MRCLETGCSFLCSSTVVLQRHLIEIHDLPVKYSNFKFDNLEEFKKWKCDFETKEACRFVTKEGTSIDEFDKMVYLYCSRSNSVSLNSSHSCTASIKLYREISANKLKAIVCSTHYGHDKVFLSLRSTEELKNGIAEKPTSEISQTYLIDSLQSTSSMKNPQLNTTILNPIARKDDWLNEIDSNEADSPILFYKKFDVDDKRPEMRKKCLIIMTKTQRDLFVKFCNNGMLYVTVTKLSSKLFSQLTVIYVLDDFYEMFPVCFMIDNKTDRPMLNVCFDQILNSIGPVTVRALATDDQKWIFDIWCEVMGHNTQHLIANCHIDALWRLNLKIIDDEILQGEIYDKLYDFIENADGSYSKMHSLIEELRSNDEASSFASYLENNFLDNVKLWSTFYLKHTYNYRDPIDYETSCGKISAMCDHSVKCDKSISSTVKSLIKLLVDLQSNRNCKIAESLVQIKNAHAASIPSYVTENIISLEKGVWKVNDKCENDKFYRVEAEHCSFDDCMLKCIDCEACVHNFRCVCDDYSDGKTCVHTHLVGTLLKIETELNQNDDHIEDSIEETKADIVDYHELSSLKTDTLAMLDSISKNLLASTDETIVEKLYNTLKDLQGNLDAMMNYGEHAQKVWLSNNCKPARRKCKKRRATIKRVDKKVESKKQQSSAMQKSIETPKIPDMFDRPPSDKKSIETENETSPQKKRHVQIEEQESLAMQKSIKTPKNPDIDRPPSDKKSTETENATSLQKKRHAQTQEPVEKKQKVQIHTKMRKK